MDSELKVSIITPVYNSASYLSLTIESAVRQTYQNWELILVDDGSKDNSWEIMTAWEKQDVRIKCYSHPGRVNKGVSATRNLGVNVARGSLIALLDSDDIWLPDKLSKQVEVFRNNPDVGLVYGIATIIDENGEPYAASDFPESCGNAPYNGKNESLFTQMVGGGITVPCLTVMTTKAVITEAGCFNERFKMQVEDHFLFTLIAYRHSLYFMNEVIALYRLHPNSYTRKNEWKFSFFEYYKELYSFIDKKDYPIVNAARFAFVFEYVRYLPFARSVKALNYLYHARLIPLSVFLKALLRKIVTKNE